jgi:hypothetical protein
MGSIMLNRSDMTNDLNIEQRLLRKIQQLPARQIAEIEDFIDFLSPRNQVSEQNLVSPSTHLAENVFAKVWDNPEDADYDNL